MIAGARSLGLSQGARGTSRMGSHMLARVRPNARTGAWPGQATALPEFEKGWALQAKGLMRPAHVVQLLADLGIAKAEEPPHIMHKP